MSILRRCELNSQLQKFENLKLEIRCVRNDKNCWPTFDGSGLDGFGRVESSTRRKRPVLVNHTYVLV